MGLACQVMDPARLAQRFRALRRRGGGRRLAALRAGLRAGRGDAAAAGARRARRRRRRRWSSSPPSTTSCCASPTTSSPPTTRRSAARARRTRRSAPRWPRFCAAREAQLAATLATRRTQTNEVARCAGLLPAFAAVAGGRPLAQIEIGASAGLNGLWDHYAYEYAGRRRGGCRVAAADRLRAARRRRAAARPAAGGVARRHRPLPLRPPRPRRRPLAARLPVAGPAGAARALRGGAGGRARARAGRRPPRRRARAPPGRDRVGAGRRARVRVPHRRRSPTSRASRSPRCARCSASVDRDVAWVGGEAPGILVGEPLALGAPLGFAVSAGRPGAARAGRPAWGTTAAG